LSAAVSGWVARQGTVRGLDLVDFNFPQHFLEGSDSDSGSGSNLNSSAEAVLAQLSRAGLKAGAICIRFPPEMRLG
jgi:xylose isomerase